MSKILRDDFNVLYENDSTSNYIVLKTVIDMPVINYQVQMLLNNKLNGLLRFNINYVEDYVNCFYDVTSKCTLSAFLSRKSFSRDEFLKTILKIINNIYQLKSYLLYESNIILDENFIYVEPESIGIYFVYLPFTGYENDLKAFLLKFIFKLAKFRDEYSDNYLQRILEVLKSDYFNIADLRLLVENLIGEEVKNQISNMSPDVQNSEEAACTDKARTHRFRSNKSERVLNKTDKVKEDISKEVTLRSDKCDDEKALTTRGNIKIPHSPKLDSKKKEKQHKRVQQEECKYNSMNENKTKQPKKFLLMILFIQLLIIITFIVAVSSSFTRLSDNPTNTIAILIFIFLCIDILAIRIVIEKKKDITDSVSCTAFQKIVAAMSEKTKPNAVELDNSTINIKDEKSLAPVKNKDGETEIIKISRTGNTTYLKEKEGDKTITISKKNVLIGRMESFVDIVIINNAVGKIHAEIMKEEEDFYVMDCNSRNGTFLNETRIEPNTKNKLSSNDILRFANAEYIFYTSSI